MSKWLLIILISVVVFAGCSEEQQQDMDRVAEKVNDVVVKAEAVIASPVGAMVPPVARIWGEAGIVLAGVLAYAWQKYRKLKIVTKSIVNAVELAGDSGDAVKPLVANLLELNGIYNQGKALITALKQVPPSD